MDWQQARDSAREALTPAAWAYYQGTAGHPADADRDHQAWQRIDLVPRVLRGLTSVDTTTTIGEVGVATPVMVAATAAHGLADPAGEIATARAAAAAGALMVYSGSAAVEVTAFGAAATAPWWAQLYLLTDRGRTNDYLDRLTAAGAAAVVLTVDLAGALASAPFRSVTATDLGAVPGNFPGLTWPQMSALIDPALTVDHIGQIADRTGLPVYVKGVLHAADAEAAVDAGAAGIIVSNHGRRQAPGVVPTAVVLPEVAGAVAGAVPVMVDGGIRSGADVFRALALGAIAVGIGRPVLWSLATGGERAVTATIVELTAELSRVMAACGVAEVDQITADLVRSQRG